MPFKKGRKKIDMNNNTSIMKEIYRVMLRAGDVSKYMQFEYTDHNQLREMRIATDRAVAERNADKLRKEYEPLLNENIKVLNPDQWQMYENNSKEYTEWVKAYALKLIKLATRKKR